MEGGREEGGERSKEIREKKEKQARKEVRLTSSLTHIQ